MTKIAVISTDNRVHGVDKALELLDINPVKNKHVVFFQFLKNQKAIVSA